MRSRGTGRSGSTASRCRCGGAPAPTPMAAATPSRRAPPPRVGGAPRHIGMGGDHIVEALLSAEVEERLGDDIRAAEKTLYFQLIDEVEPLPGARELLVELKRRGHATVLCSSAKQEELLHYVE